MIKNPGFTISFIIIFIVLITLFVANTVIVRDLIKKIDQRTEEIQILVNANKELRSEYESLIAKDRIEKIAITQLGMINPAEAPILLKIPREKLSQLEEN